MGAALDSSSPLLPRGPSMKLLLRLGLVTLAAGAVGLTLSCASTREAAAAAGRAPAEVRAVWVVRYDLSSPAAVRAMVEEAAASRFNTLLVQVRGRGDAVYASALEPRAEFLRDQPDFDALQLTIEAARARGLAVHAWVNAYLVWGLGDRPLDPRHLVNAHPEWLAVRAPWAGNCTTATHAIHSTSSA